MPKNAKKGGDDAVERKLPMRVASLIVAVLLIGAVATTAYFVSDTLKTLSGGSFRLNEEDREAIETIDLERLSGLLEKIEAKNRLDEPRAGRLRNPFAEYVPEPEQAPTSPSVNN